MSTLPRMRTSPWSYEQLLIDFDLLIEDTFWFRQLCPKTQLLLVSCTAHQIIVCWQFVRITILAYQDSANNDSVIFMAFSVLLLSALTSRSSLFESFKNFTSQTNHAWDGRACKNGVQRICRKFLFPISCNNRKSFAINRLFYSNS